jgi:hypothetical protein
MDTLIERFGAANLAAGVALCVGGLVLVLALRALTNAALALRARLFALGSGLALTAAGLGKPLGWDRRATAWLAGWLDTPLEQAAAIALAALVFALLIGVVLLYFWIRAMMRLAWLAFAGVCLALTAGAVVLAGEGVIAVPPWLAETGVLASLAGGLLLLLGVVRMLRVPASR